MAKNNESEHFEKKKVRKNTKVVCFDGPVSEQAQHDSTPQTETMRNSSEVLETEGWNPFKFQWMEISITDENIGKMLLDKRNRRGRAKEGVEEKQKEMEEIGEEMEEIIEEQCEKEPSSPIAKTEFGRLAKEAQ
ncbi:hypothetical protein Csa_018381 [Cucumis sativus]|uniref:Uncharacterized protein n=1 Tax=Cucumis sativus TaxID=3659 RepID=A0A0A0KJ97_CUCSA|nr:hypothetical protein Csa_018381 [Cucumis sativus]